MCFENCGPELYDDPKLQAEEDAAYQEWIDSQFPEDEEEEEEEEDSRIEMSEREADESFQDFVNELNDTVTICGYDFDPAPVLKEADPVAYRTEFLSWIDSREKDGTHVFPWNV